MSQSAHTAMMKTVYRLTRRGERRRGEKEDETESTSGEAAGRGEKKEWRKKGQEDGKEEKEPLQHDPGHTGAPFQPDRQRRQT